MTDFGVGSNPHTGFDFIIDHNDEILIDHNGEAVNGGDFVFTDTTESNPHG